MSATQPSAQSYVQLADQRTKAGDIAGAIAALEMAVRLQPTHPAAHYNLALACLNAGMTERAASGFRQAIALKPTSTWASCCRRAASARGRAGLPPRRCRRGAHDAGPAE